MKIAVIFPAFVPEYSGNEAELLTEYGINFPILLEQASGILECDLTEFDLQTKNFLDDEAKTQYISYIFSCAVADIISAKKVKPSFISAYSMGIYAALYYCRSLSFGDGLRLVKIAWETISGVTKGGDYGMGMVIGLDQKDILTLMKPEKDIEICNINNKYTYILSGARRTIENVLVSAKAEGALKTTILPVTRPYHSRFMKDCPGLFETSISGIKFSDPHFPYLSSLLQNIIESGSELRYEVIRNLAEKMNWNGTMERLVELGADIIFECGAGEGLTRNSRFIDGTFQSFPTNRLNEFLKLAT